MTTVLITGANRGIGLEFAKQYAAEGADVIACCRETAKADALKSIKGKVRITALTVDNSDSVAALKKELGATAIDILINNAGISGPRGKREGIIDFDAWLKTFAVNSLAPVMMAFAFEDNLKAGKQKKLVTITSQLGSITNHGGGAVAYNASKAAVNSLMHGLALAWARNGLLVGIFHPGWVKTDMGGASAPVTPQESVKGLRAQIAKLNATNSGAYLDYAGKEISW